MKRVKLFAAPLFLAFSRQARDLDLLQSPVVVIQSPSPMPSDNRIAKRAAMRCLYTPAVEGTLVRIVMAFGARRKRSWARTKVRTSMFRVTIRTTNASGYMRFDHSSNEGIGAMATRTSRLHVAAERVAVCARVSIWLFRYHWKHC
jgi:hypothetical protein